ncbi:MULTISPECIES: iron ABC transporter permease [Eubacteriales]|uniref:ABC transporter permease n=1 Tax=Eubacteriales TaxID=186802 RepID=UPI00026F20E7|nr:MULTISPECIES: iron ABC transporter permease [Eubacteriales]EJF40830.1 ABC transporter, permease protein [Clostridium sp. MSTE9]
MKTKKMEVWTGITFLFLGLFFLFLIYPMFGVLQQSVRDANGSFSLAQFAKFFSKQYYINTVLNSFKVSIAVTLVTLLIGIPFSYFYSFYQLKGTKFLFVLAVLCCMSAPFIGAYAWILLLGRSGVVTQVLEGLLGIHVGNIYGFNGILLVQALKLFPLVFVYMNGAFKNIDNTLMEASANMGCVGIKRFFNVLMRLSMPTVLAAALLVFMRAFADFGTPLLIGEGYRTFPVEIYNQYLGETGQNHNFAAAISVIAIVVTALVFLLQKWGTSKFKFSINALHPIDKKKPKGILGVLMYLYSYLLVLIAFLPQVYIIYLSFRNCDQAVFKPGFSLDSYHLAIKKLLVRSINNTVLLGIGSLIIIVIMAILIAYLVVRRGNVFNHAIDTMSMLPYIMPGSVIGIALVIAFNQKPMALTGTMTIMIVALVIRRMPYTIRSATATLMQISPSVEEAAISLGASKMKTFWKITVPMMSSGIVSGAILSFVSIVTEMSSGIILYNNKTITLTMSAYVAIGRGNYGLACAFSAILTVLTAAILLAYLFISKDEDIKM